MLLLGSFSPVYTFTVAVRVMCHWVHIAWNLGLQCYSWYKYLALNTGEDCITLMTQRC